MIHFWQFNLSTDLCGIIMHKFCRMKITPAWYLRTSIKTSVFHEMMKSPKLWCGTDCHQIQTFAKSISFLIPLRSNSSVTTFELVPNNPCLIDPLQHILVLLSSTSKLEIPMLLPFQFYIDLGLTPGSF